MWIVIAILCVLGVAAFLVDRRAAPGLNFLLACAMAVLFAFSIPNWVAPDVLIVGGSSAAATAACLGVMAVITGYVVMVWENRRKAVFFYDAVLVTVAVVAAALAFLVAGMVACIGSIIGSALVALVVFIGSRLR